MDIFMIILLPLKHLHRVGEIFRILLFSVINARIYSLELPPIETFTRILLFAFDYSTALVLLL